ncbi:MAG: UvrD-helicase domain-containing protein [Candidatus Kapabacteria bacterium]|nr:UvrD-helicase domain-containing protein [Candidatus Kapabacteria bacterium]
MSQNNTYEQQIAQTYDRNMLITANAGSGKTRVLVQRYIDLIWKENVHPSRIVAITFTKKAASEMLKKISDEISKLTLQASSPYELIKLQKIRESLTSAHISTIHQFCSSIIRDNPVEADVPSTFTELTGVDQKILIENHIKNILLETAASLNFEKSEHFRNFFNLFDINDIIELLNFILNNTDRRINFEKLYKNHPENDFQRRIYEYAIRVLLPDTKNYLKNFNSLFSSAFNGSLKKDKIEKVEEGLKDINELLNEINNFEINFQTVSVDDEFEGESRSFNAINTEKSEKFISTGLFSTEKVQLRQILGEKIGNFLSIQSSFNNFCQTWIGKTTFFPDKRKFGINELPDFFLKKENKDKIKILVKFNNSLKFYKFNSLIYENNLTLLELVESALTAIEEEKSIYGLLDFDDLLFRATALLDFPKVYDKIRNQINYLLIDEFQDTNAVQYELIRKIGLSDDKKNNVNLYIVGDAKQSIYGFRDADVRLTNKAKKAIAIINGNKIKSGILLKEFRTKEGLLQSQTEEQSLGMVNLSATFRLLPAIAHFTNIVCSKIMNSGFSEYDVDYNPLVCARNVAFAKNEFSEKSEKDNYLGKIEFLITINDKQKNNSKISSESIESNDIEYISEEELVARRIARLVATNATERISDKETGLRKIEYKDIAILSRRKTKFPKLTEQLRFLGIPYMLHGGKGLYDSQEINDLASYLRFLYNPEDDLSFASILKSEFFNFDDKDLLIIRSNGYGSSLWQNFNKINQTNAPPKKYIECFKILDNHIHISTRFPIPILINKIIEDTAFFYSVSKLNSSEQIRANIEKLVEIARDFEARGFKNLFDFIEILNNNEKFEIDESEAQIRKDTNAINILTVHSAKGLEFPVVILLDTNFRDRNSDKWLMTKEFGLSYKQAVIDTTSGLSQLVETPFHVVNSHLKQISENADNKRLLYVAVTRAENILIISATLDKAKEYSSPHGFFELLCTALNKSPENFVNSDTISLNADLECLDKSYNKFTSTIETEIEIIKNIEYDNLDTAIAATKEIKSRFLLDQIKSEIFSEKLSASKIISTENSVDNFILQYRFGLPAINNKTFEPQSNKPDEKTDTILGDRFGNIFHKVAEKLKLWYSAVGAINEQSLKEIIDDVLYDEKFINSKVYQSIYNSCINICETALLKRYAGLVQHSTAEYNLNMPFENDFLSGTIDLLISDKNGAMEVWDWKTNSLKSAADIPFLANKYKTQLMLYSYFVMKLFPNQKLITSRLLFTRLAAKDAADKSWTQAYIWTREEINEFENLLLSKRKIYRELMFGSEFVYIKH